MAQTVPNSQVKEPPPYPKCGHRHVGLGGWPLASQGRCFAPHPSDAVDSGPRQGLSKPIWLANNRYPQATLGSAQLRASLPTGPLGPVCGVELTGALLMSAIFTVYMHPPCTQPPGPRSWGGRCACASLYQRMWFGYSMQSGLTWCQPHVALASCGDPGGEWIRLAQA